MGLADAYDCILFDLDGVLYRGDRPTPHAGEAVSALRAVGRRIAFVTNNSSLTPEEVRGKLGTMGIEASVSEVVTSAVATADLLVSRAALSAFVVGEEGIRRALADEGIAVLDGEPESVEYVVVGWDRSANYAKLRTACLLVERGAGLVATNADPSYPAPDGLWPGAGALLAVITTTTGAVPEIVGKPHAPLFLSALRRVGGERPLVVGDRIDTDVAGARALGWDSLLVLTGVSTEADVERAAVRPTHVAPDLSVLIDGPSVPQD
jgi:HAD superfamily hydrolase (TIGR01457 family)